MFSPRHSADGVVYTDGKMLPPLQEKQAGVAVDKKKRNQC
jgi:hypothetical protein